MALVVTARAPARLEAGRWIGLRSVATTGAVVYTLALITDAAARTLPNALDTPNLVLTGAASALAVLVCVTAWLTRRHDGALLLAATLTFVLTAIRVVVTGILVSAEMSTLSEVVDDSVGLIALGTLVWTATGSHAGPQMRATPRRALFCRVVDVTAFVLFAVALSGAAVQAVGASWACQGVFPDCNGLGVLPFGRDPQADIQLYHRLLAYAAFGLVLWLTIEAFRTQRKVVGLTRAAALLLGTSTLDAVVGAVSVSVGTPPLAEIAHSAVTMFTCCAATVLLVTAHRGREQDVMAGNPLALVSAYVQLTKPRVMSLLLATTGTAMVIAARGMPDLGLLVATLVGGALMSGGAGAINHYVDRDIDPLMGRTAWRPIPSGVIKPSHALWFGIGLALIASGVFLVFVNPLAMVLALIGLLGYVFIYTLWLKRSTPSNIVIGGAAGAIPPLVGWAAVTHEIGSLTAWYLFAIIFFWTPPHFWALSLLIRQHYERAGVPMLPVVRGEEETRRQIILYSILLVVLTLVLSPFGMMGPLYFVAALLLGGLFVLDAVRLWREATRQAARRLYLYSILYLFALFTAMAVDRVLTR